MPITIIVKGGFGGAQCLHKTSEYNGGCNGDEHAFEGVRESFGSFTTIFSGHDGCGVCSLACLFRMFGSKITYPVLRVVSRGTIAQTRKRQL